MVRASLPWDREFHLQQVGPPVGSLVNPVVLERQRLQQIAASVEEFDLANLEHVLVDPRELTCVARVLVTRAALDDVAGEVAARLAALRRD